MFCVQITFWQYFKNFKQGFFLPPPSDTSVVGGGKTTPRFNVLKYCKNVIGAQNMLVYFRLHYLYICQGV